MVTRVSLGALIGTLLAGALTMPAQSADDAVVLRLSQTAVVAGDPVRLELQLPSSDAHVETIVVDPPQSLQPAGSSNNVSIVNGRMSQSYTRSFQLVPSQAGLVTLGPARVLYNGRILLSNTVKLVVQASGSERQLAMDITAEPADVWEGQPFVVRTTVHHGAGFRPVEFVPPDADGVERFAGQPELDQRTDAVQMDGATLSRLTMLDWRVPTGLGTLSLGGGAVRLEKTGASRSRRLDPFAGFFGNGRSSFSQALPSVRVQVRPLPDVPSGMSFAGLVGHVEVRWQSVTREADRTRAILQLSGTGNADSFALGSWVQDGYRVYPDTPDIKHGMTQGGQPAVVVRVPLTFVAAHEPDSARPAWFDVVSGSFRALELPASGALHALPPTTTVPYAHTHADAAPTAERIGTAPTTVRYQPEGLALAWTQTMAQVVAVLGCSYLLLWGAWRVRGPLQRRRNRPLQGLRLTLAVRTALARDSHSGWTGLYRRMVGSSDPRAAALVTVVSTALFAPEYNSPAADVRATLDQHAQR